MTLKKSLFVLSLVASACLGTFAIAQDQPTTAPDFSAIIAVSDQAALEANKDKDVTVEGVVSEAAWSGTGKVMNIRFDDAKDTHFSAIVFVKNKERIDAAFGGDATKAWTGAKVRIHGKLREYTGKSGNKKATPEITISEPAQVTVVELPTSQPAK